MSFSRRHPLLFTMLVMSAISGFVIISLTALVLTRKGDHSSLGFGDRVGVIEVTGVITDSKTVLQQLKAFRDEKDVKSIVLRIDSPGGGVGPSQEIYEEVRKTRRVKKVVASMGSVAASGGYYIAAAADHIKANPGTLTGSIGVIVEFADIQELLKKIGLAGNTIKSGKFKDVGSPLRKMTDEERTLLQKVIDTVHRQFIKAVAEGRGLPEVRVRPIADGRIMSGEQAKELGLLDSFGNLEDAIALAAQLGGIKGEPNVVYAKPPDASLLEYLIGSSITNLMGNVAKGSIPYGHLFLASGIQLNDQAAVD